jgi:hypothetical protein
MAALAVSNRSIKTKTVSIAKSPLAAAIASRTKLKAINPTMTRSECESVAVFGIDPQFALYPGLSHALD